MSVANADAAIKVERLFSVLPGEIFAAFEQPEKLAKWWGPAGFTNTFELFEFKPGGRWVYVMHGPDGRDYPNESAIAEIDRYKRIVIEHVVLPLYKLTITLTEVREGTHLAWAQEFDNREFATKMHEFLSNANEQNLDRLEALLAGEN